MGHSQEGGWRWQARSLGRRSLGRCLLRQKGQGQVLGGGLNLGKLPAERQALAISWVTMKRSPPIFLLRCDLCLLSLPIFLLHASLPAPGSIFLKSDN